MELIKAGDKTYYIKNATNTGIYKTNDTDVFLIDTGNDKDAGKKILKTVEQNGWNVKGIISTHSNADHIGGNKVIQDRTGCKDLRNKFLLAKESVAVPIENNLPDGLEYFSLKGHFF